MDDKAMSILDHLNALRRAIIVSILALIPGTAIGWYVREPIMQILIAPVRSMHYQLVFIGATEAFMAQLQIAILAGVAIAMPVIAYQFWKFILPALHSHERKYIVTFVPISLVLFAVGIIFGYYTVFTVGVQFLLSFGGEGLTPMLSLGKYLSFAFWFLLPFGVMFEMPLVILALVRLGIISSKFLGAQRKWVFIGAFVIAAVVTPTTDMLSQSVMAAAMYLLYEVSIWLSYLVRPSEKALKRKLEAEAAAAELEEPKAVPVIEAPTAETPKQEEKKESTVEAVEEPVPSQENENRDMAEVYRDIIEKGNNEDSDK